MSERNYTVTGINGYRRAYLTREQAIKHARQLNEQMSRLGWRGKARAWYRDGSEIVTTET